MRIVLTMVMGLLVAALPATAQTAGASGNSKMMQQEFGKTADGRTATLYTLKNKHGVEVAITNYGASVVSIKVPDRHGVFVDVAHGYEDVAGYAAGKANFGGTIGRYANRIAHG